MQEAPHNEKMQYSALFYKELETAQRYLPDYNKVYQVYNHVFQQCLNHSTASAMVHLCGAFAKTDYLLQELQAPTHLARNINDTRVRLRKYHKLTEGELERHHLVDLRNLSTFIAFLYSTKIPDTLVGLFPAEKPHDHSPQLFGECMRIIIDTWDDQYVYGQPEDSSDGTPVKVCYVQNDAEEEENWKYLKDLFHRGAQLNLVRPREDDAVFYPELIIYEPDCLINISTVAHCFENYATSPLVDLIKKMAPQPLSAPLIMGNFASQLLDESICQLPASHTYQQSIMEFFKSNALKLLAIGANNEFHQEALSQQRNINRAVHTTLPTALKRFDPKEGLVEPSFFSEMLGMQGRMDYLQSDFKVLIEQKSGKGEFPYDYFITPRHKVDHYVQLLLYMALIRYNYHDIYEGNGKELHAFLLYSKYQESLLGLGFAPKLIYQAIKIRNELAWWEFRFSQPDGYRILETLTPEKMNLKKVTNSLWKDHQSKQIADLLSPIHMATDLERAYYFRFLTFIANEHILSKLGSRSKENSGFASTWHDTLEEKLHAGNIYDRLSLVSPTPQTEGKIESVTLQFSETSDNDMSNFRVGDIVILYPYKPGQEPDVRKTMVFRSSIAEISPSTIRLDLRSAQSDNRVFVREQGKMWAIEHDFMESSFSSLYRGMHAFLSAPKQRRDLLLLQREPLHDDTLQLKGDYGPFNELALRVKRAKELFLIIGPPGTGKTSYGLLNTLREELLEPDSSILLLSYTNRAIDEICDKLSEAGIDFIRIGTSTTCPEPHKPHLLSQKVQGCHDINDVKKLLDSTRVFVGNTTSISAHQTLFLLKQFSLAIVDEASQILEPHLIGIFSAQFEGEPAIRKFVLIGDHKQLPAVVQQHPSESTVDDPLLQDILLTDCRLSLFERLLKKYRENEHVTYMLRRQGRMHPDIAMFPNLAFYQGKLMEVPLSHQQETLPSAANSNEGITNLLTTRRIAFVASELPEETPSDKVNQVEADIIAATIQRIHAIEKEHFDVNETVGVIVPYRNQIATIRNTLDHYGSDILHDITIDTVERYQGSQRKYIIYGFTIQKYDQLRFLTSNVFEDTDGSMIDRKLNVAMTRAKEHLIMVGNPTLLHQDPVFSRLIQFLKERHCYFEVGTADYVSGRFEVT